MDPFKKKTESQLLDEIFVKDTIKETLNKPKKEVKFTWEGLKNFVPFLETNPFDPSKVKRIKELSEGKDTPKEKDYIDGFEEIERTLYGGVQDLGYSIRSEEHTSELQSRLHLVCRLLLEKKKKIQLINIK